MMSKQRDKIPITIKQALHWLVKRKIALTFSTDGARTRRALSYGSTANSSSRNVFSIINFQLFSISIIWSFLNSCLFLLIAALFSKCNDSGCEGEMGMNIVLIKEDLFTEFHYYISLCSEWHRPTMLCSPWHGKWDDIRLPIQPNFSKAFPICSIRNSRRSQSHYLVLKYNLPSVCKSS